ncbi:MAG: hypothetical protein UT86_C0001G0246 [Candidatus Magasanikbacteria bacterium GW2011_GWC2_40_17]|uniref:Uncharacterized protein n=1 Tax=Candidatus Magasanikbacteria bacterium GW2011_GWA2_42_32 TaxID=1619039 RepID=A0A0G1CGC7_9BACT|nr:MAG: hypothetical protein UT86_C0001G0246 [Candidatus Magasanikbacteria bacterium GW2011_GWC2_40_17]KKS57606.1 MAG: hypothetical protein UV20_C0001G0246 [Candidatus Magasanikbacteria bacterium GW2011_GWA2_42_32]
MPFPQTRLGAVSLTASAKSARTTASLSTNSPAVLAVAPNISAALNADSTNPRPSCFTIWLGPWLLLLIASTTASGRGRDASGSNPASGRETPKSRGQKSSLVWTTRPEKERKREKRGTYGGEKRTMERKRKR